MGVTRKTGVPLYLQVRDVLLRRIEQGTWPPGAILPTENQLCDELGVSKITVREAMRLLVRAERLVRIPGKGTFVSDSRYSRFENRLGKFFSFTRWAQKNQLEPASRILKVESVKCNGQTARRLLVPEESTVVRIERLRLGNDEPLMLEQIWVSQALCPELHLKDLANIPFDDILAEHYQIQIVRATESLEPTLADAYVASLLGVPEGTLLLAIEYTTFDNSSRVVYFVTGSYRSDRIKFTIELTK